MARDTREADRSDVETPSHSVRWGLALLAFAVVVLFWGHLVVPREVSSLTFLGLAVLSLMALARTRGAKPKRVIEGWLDDSDLVVVTVVATEAQAEIVRGRLEANGVTCRYRQTNFAAGSMDGIRGGPQQIMVREVDLSRAHELLAEGR